MRSIRAIENSDVCVLMIDATRGIEGQDINIFQLIQKNQKGLVVVINKWDLVEDKSNEAIKYFEKAIRESHFMASLPVKFGRLFSCWNTAYLN
jgi:GTP-binding protein